MPPAKCKIGIFGGSGMTGAELLRLAVTHPKMELVFVHSRHHAGERIGQVHAFLEGLTDLRFSGEEPEKLFGSVDAIFLAVGHGEATEMLERIKEFKGPIIDITIDHRLSDSFVYGISDIDRKSIQGAKRISNPGCFATAAILAAAPLIKSDLLEETLFFSSVTGSSGAGIAPVATTHHPFRDGNLFAYKVFQHQHEPEIVRSLTSIGGRKRDVILAAHSGPFVRGIHCTMHARAKDHFGAERLNEISTNFYKDAPFVRLRSAPPALKTVVGSNFCDLYVTSRGLDVIVISVLDNLVKGASGQAIQNLNIAMGWDEKEGLWNPPLFP